MESVQEQCHICGKMYGGFSYDKYIENKEIHMKNHLNEIVEIKKEEIINEPEVIIDESKVIISKHVKKFKG